MKRQPHIMPLSFKVLLILILMSPSVRPQASVINQTITLHVAELNSMVVPQEPIIVSSEGPPVDASAVTRLIWTSTGPGTKVSVAQPVPQGTLRISVRDLDHRAAAVRDVTITDSSTVDLLQGLGRSAGSCTLELSLLSEGWLSFPLLILYTITGG